MIRQSVGGFGDKIMRLFVIWGALERKTGRGAIRGRFARQSSPTAFAAGAALSSS
jgi:hypothetical protein